MTNNFGSNIKTLLKERNLSVREFARQIKVSQKTAQDWVSGDGNRIPRNAQVLKDIASYFGCSVYCLLFGEEDPKSLISEILEKTEIHTGLYEISIRKVKTKGGMR